MATITLEQFKDAVKGNKETFEQNGVSRGTISTINALRYVQCAVLHLKDGSFILVEDLIPARNFMKFSSDDQFVNQKNLEI